MIILDNSVLSALTFLQIIDYLTKLDSVVATTNLVISEYSQKWTQKSVPTWIQIFAVDSFEIKQTNHSMLTVTDYSLLQLAQTKNALLATDDLALRKIAKSLNILIIGTIGLLKIFYQRKFIPTLEEYLQLIKLLQSDLYLSSEILDWAKDI